MRGGCLVRFLGRKQDLLKLEQLWARSSAQLVLMYGRRRIGKTYLLQEFITGKQAIFYQATQQAAEVELAAFSDFVRSLLRLPPGVNFPNWEVALEALSDYATGKRLVVVLDEFPNLCESTKGLPSLIQRWWDHKGRHSHIMLILCGSAQTFMNELDMHAAPLYGRFTARLGVQPLSYREAAEFVPDLSSEEKALVYGLLGGTPFYLDQWETQASFRDNVMRLFGDSLSALIDAPDRMLTTTLNDARSAYRVLQAVAFGKTRWAEIRDFAKVHDRAITQLVTIGLLERRVPITEDALRSRRVRYRIPDPNLRFWFRFILPHRSQIERGLGRGVVESQILPLLDDHMGQVYEDIAREFAYELVTNGVLSADDVGYWQSSDGQNEIDIVGAQNHHPTFYGTVKWQKQPIDQRVIANLEGHIQALNLNLDVPRLIIGRNAPAPITAPLTAGFGADDLYGSIETAAASLRVQLAR